MHKVFKKNIEELINDKKFKFNIEDPIAKEKKIHKY